MCDKLLSTYVMNLVHVNKASILPGTLFSVFFDSLWPKSVKLYKNPAATVSLCVCWLLSKATTYFILTLSLSHSLSLSLSPSPSLSLLPSPSQIPPSSQLKKLMVVGIDTYHDSSSRGRSVGGFIASTNPNLTK